MRYQLTRESRIRLAQLTARKHLNLVGETSNHPFVTNPDGLIMAVVNLQIQKPDDTYTDPVQVEFDSGADISCLPTQQAAQLGLPTTSNDTLEMSGVDGKPFTVYLLNYTLKLVGLSEPLQVPFAVSGVEDTALFGREGVWNQFSAITFDQVNKQTVFSK